MPAATGIFRDMTAVRYEHPVFVAENCTACGNCYSVCPDTAIPGLVSSVADVFDSDHQARSKPAASPHASCAARCARLKRNCAR